VNRSGSAKVPRASAPEEEYIKFGSEIMIVSCDGVDCDGNCDDGDNGENTG
jgi:hypothetical protein